MVKTIWQNKEEFMKTTALIMAGGKGERFWPKSRVNMPKQFLSLTDDGKTMIQLTVERISPLVDIKDVYVATNKNYRELVKQQLPGIPEENILCEPVGRNTAPCVGLGAVHVASKYDDAVMIVLPSDHLIKNNEVFADNHDDKKNNAYSVEKFVEKPDLETAKSYLADGTYLWNSGMFVWKVSTILDCFKKFMPDTYEGLLKIKAAVGTADENAVLEAEFPNLESQSVDYGIMEKADNVVVIDGEFGWNDVGSWDTLGVMYNEDENGNISKGENIMLDTKNSVVFGNKRLIATIGLDNIVVVETDDAILVCDKNKAQSVKDVVDILKERKLDKYL